MEKVEDVIEDLMKAYWVSLKVDSSREEVWRKINRFHLTLHLASILEGILEFVRAYNGELTMETMFVTIDGNDVCYHCYH